MRGPTGIWGDRKFRRLAELTASRRGCVEAYDRVVQTFSRLPNARGNTLFQLFVFPRYVVGGPLAANNLKCRLKPIDLDEYAPSDAEEATHPSKRPQRGTGATPHPVDHCPAATAIAAVTRPGRARHHGLRRRGEAATRGSGAAPAAPPQRNGAGTEEKRRSRFRDASHRKRGIEGRATDDIGADA